MSSPPSAVAWASGGVSVLHQGRNRQGGGPDGQLWYTYSPDGTNWEGDTHVLPSVGMSGSPSAVVVENGNLYVFHQGSNEDGQLWYTYFDGTNWASDTQVPNLGMSGSPSAVVWAGGISVFHQGFGDDQQLWYTYTPDGTNWGPDTQVRSVGISGSPSCVVFSPEPGILIRD